MMEGGNLASNVIFFLGAGASVAAGIPAVGPMTEEFLEKIKKDGSPCCGTLEEIMLRLKKALAQENPPRKLDVELILQTVHRLIAYPKDELSEFFSNGHGLEPAALENLKDALELFIRNKVIRPRSVEYLSPLLDSEWGKPAHIFSVNYDPCIELLCKNLQRRLIDGFTPEWNPRSLETDDPEAVHLYKLHGSVLWYRSEDGWYVKIPIAPNNNSSEKIELYDGRKAAPVILYPMAKQPMEAPLLDFAYILKRRLESAKFLIVIGYSFRDDYLAALFRDAFNANPDLHMISIGPESRKHYHELIARGPSFKNVFEWRVTCLPFPAERILQDFTANQFRSLMQNLKSWQDYRNARMTGRKQIYRTFIGPLSHSGEVAIPNYLLNTLSEWREIEITGLWSVVFRNYAMAVAMRDEELARSTADKIYKLLNRIKTGLLVEIVYSSGLHVMLKLPRFGGQGALAAPIQFHEFLPVVQNTSDEIYSKFTQNTSSKNVRGLLENLRRAMQACIAFINSVPTASLGMSVQEFRVMISPQLSLRTQDVAQRLAQLERDIAGRSAESNKECQKRSMEIMEIFQKSQIKSFVDLSKVVEDGVNFLHSLKSDPIGKAIADQ